LQFINKVNKNGLKLKDKVAVVTGSSKGIDAGIAKAFANAGAKVVVNYASDKVGVEKVVKEIAKNGGIAIAIHCDVTKLVDVQRMFKKQKSVWQTGYFGK
jgi:3-oxoacyl-[acyl-carrier protein] reductase